MMSLTAHKAVLLCGIYPPHIEIEQVCFLTLGLRFLVLFDSHYNLLLKKVGLQLNNLVISWWLI